MQDLRTRARGNEGSAFVISILVLFVLSVLGLALMLTTTTEKDIAINYRWGEQAFFNADAALEYGKNELANFVWLNTDFSNILPPARPDVVVNPGDGRNVKHPDGGACDPTTAGCRDYQYFVDQCQQDGTGPCTRIFIGRVLRRADGTLAQNDFRQPPAMPGDLDGDGARDIDGTFTLWVRRPIVGTADYDQSDRVILTAEGTAPNSMGAGAGKYVSLRRLEMSIRLPTSGIEGTKYSGPLDGSDDSDAKSSGVGTTQIN